MVEEEERREREREGLVTVRVSHGVWRDLALWGVSWESGRGGGKRGGKQREGEGLVTVRGRHGV